MKHLCRNSVCDKDCPRGAADGTVSACQDDSVIGFKKGLLEHQLHLFVAVAFFQFFSFSLKHLSRKKRRQLPLFSSSDPVKNPEAVPFSYGPGRKGSFLFGPAVPVDQPSQEEIIFIVFPDRPHIAFYISLDFVLSSKNHGFSFTSLPFRNFFMA